MTDGLTEGSDTASVWLYTECEICCLFLKNGQNIMFKCMFPSQVATQVGVFLARECLDTVSPDEKGRKKRKKGVNKEN